MELMKTCLKEGTVLSRRRDVGHPRKTRPKEEGKKPYKTNGYSDPYV